MKTSDFYYDLPEELIAQDPLLDRSSSRLMVLDRATGQVSHHIFKEIIDYLNTFDNLYCVGRNGQHRYNNMDHSMVTSFETVKNIVNNIKDKSNIWNVNTDKEYHETKE